MVPLTDLSKVVYRGQQGLGSFSDLAFQVLQVPPVFNLQFASPEGVEHLDPQLIKIKGFDQVPIGADGQRLLRRLQIVYPALHDNDRIGVLLGNIFNQFETGFPGQIDVG